jgi:hypothetical protein
VVSGHDAPTVGGHKQKEERVRSEKTLINAGSHAESELENDWISGMFQALTQQ